MVKKPTLILLGIFIIFAGFAWWMQKSPNSPAGGSTATPTAIPGPFSEWKFENIRLIKFEDPGGQSLGIRMGKDFSAWSLDEYPDIAADRSKVIQILSELTSIRPIAVINSAPDENAMGLGKNAKKVTLVDVSGKTNEITFGNKTPTGSGSYIKSGESYYIINTQVIDNVTTLLTLQGIVRSTEIPATVSVTPQS